MISEADKLESDLNKFKELLDKPETWSKIAVKVLEDVDIDSESMDKVIATVNEHPQVAYGNAPLWRNIALLLFVDSLELKKLKKSSSFVMGGK